MSAAENKAVFLSYASQDAEWWQAKSRCESIWRVPNGTRFGILKRDRRFGRSNREPGIFMRFAPDWRKFPVPKITQLETLGFAEPIRARVFIPIRPPLCETPDSPRSNERVAGGGLFEGLTAFAFELLKGDRLSFSIGATLHLAAYESCDNNCFLATPSYRLIHRDYPSMGRISAEIGGIPYSRALSGR